MRHTGVLTRQVFDGRRLSHAYIANGSLADDLAMAVVCSGQGERPCLSCAHCGKASRRIHPDITFVGRLPDARGIAVDQIRELKEDVIIVPNESQKKAYVILEADLMNTAAQNALLRVLEEPPSHTVFVLSTDNPAALLPTVRSRCTRLKGPHEDETADSAALDMANRFFDALNGGNAPLIQVMFQLEKLDKEEFAAFLAAAREQTAAMLRMPLSDAAGMPPDALLKAEDLFVRAGELIELNVGVGHISGMICASFITESRQSIDRSN